MFLYSECIANAKSDVLREASMQKIFLVHFESTFTHIAHSLVAHTRMQIPQGFLTKMHGVFKMP